MLFNSFAFIVLFLPAVVIVYRTLMGARRITHAKAFLVAASLIFYAMGGVRNLPYLLSSVLINYGAGRIIQTKQGASRRHWLVAAISTNLGFLCAFKYINFFATTVFGLAGVHLLLPSLAFPLAISFFTIQQIMYLVDCYEDMSEANSLLDHAAFVMCFPYIMAGPISRAREVVPQLNSVPLRAVADDVARAITLFAIGLFKKVVFAAAFASVADTGFKGAATVSMIEAWGSAFAYTMQLYFDFSGYSDMALAAALLLGIRLKINFASPLTSASMSEFWQRWHISLSNFITTYLYTPIVRSFGRVTAGNSAKATILAMIIAGLWHGPAWTFVIFGAMHGVGLAVNQYWKRTKRKIPNSLAWALTMLWVTLAFVFFRSPSLSVAKQMLAGVAGFHGLFGIGMLVESLRSELISVGIPVLVGMVVVFRGPVSNDIAENWQLSPELATAVAGLLLVSMLFLNSTPAKEFIYIAF